MTVHRDHAAATTPDAIAARIRIVRGSRVLFDEDLAQLYGVTTKAVVQAVRRNLDRFPPDFAFLVTRKEVTNLRSQSVTSSWGGRRHPPLAFTEQGVAMLSSVLRSARAVRVNVAIMRAFVRIRGLFLEHADLARRVGELEQQVGHHDERIAAIFTAIRQLLQPERPSTKPRIGFERDV